MKSVVRIPKMLLASYDLATGMEVDMSRQVLKSAEESRHCVWPNEVALTLHSALRYGRLLLNSLAGKSATSSEPDDSE